MILWLVAIGVISLLGQVVLLRELNVAFYGSELIYVLALGLWMLWTATGAALGRRSRLPSATGVRILLLAHGCALPLALVLIREVRRLLGGVPGAYLPFPHQLLGMALCLLPVCILLGLLFQWAAKLYVDERRTLAAAYAVESAGAVLGGVLATLFLRWGMQNLRALLLCALFSVVIVLVPWRREGRRRLLPFAALAALPLLPALVWSEPLDRALTRRNHPNLAATRDSPYGRVTLEEASGQISVFENDALAFESEGTSAEEFVHLAALQRPRLRSVLVLGGGVEGVLRELLAHRPQRIDYVELNPVLVDLLADHLPPDLSGSLDHESVRITVADPRRFLETAGKYDLILVGMPEPDSGQTNRFYTREFFALCRRSLERDGVLAFRLRGAENLWTPAQSRRAASIRRALGAEFPDAVVLPGVTNIFLASLSPLSREPDRLSRRLAERGVEARLVIPEYVGYLYTNDRFHEIERILESARVPANRDARPFCYQYTLLIWLSRFFPSAALYELPDLRPARLARTPAFWLVLAATTACFALSRRRELLRRSLLAAVAGFAGMVLETTLILNYQVQRGVLYQDLGLLLTLFMAGLALGAGAADLRARRSPRPGVVSAATGMALLGLVAVLAVGTAWLTTRGAVAGLGATALLLLAAGVLVAALFAYASLRRGPDQRGIVAPLYASDLAGGCLGSLAASLILIPSMGIPGAALVTAALALIALLLV